MSEQRDHDSRMWREMDTKLERQAQRAKAEMETKLESQAQQAKSEMEALRKQLTPKPPGSVVSQAQLEALQSRLVALHTAKLLDDEAIFALEDCIGDFIECTSVVASVAAAEVTAAADKVSKLVGLSERMPKDVAFARQARRRLAVLSGKRD